MSIAKINEVCKSRYGAELLAVNMTTALWLVEHILETTGVNVYKRVSSYLNARGRGIAFPEYGSKVFAGL